MAYTLCNQACPILVADLKRIEQLLPASLGEELGFVFISIDPQRDTPDQLRSYAEKMALSTNWQLLQGDSMGVLEMAALLGVRFRKELDGTFSHSNLITLLDKEGVIIFRLEGLRQDPALLIQTILNATQ
jgi:protein SCO1/2